MKKTNEMFVKEITDKFGGNISVLDLYVNQKIKMRFHCNLCNTDFITTPQSVLHSKYGCQNCANKSISESHLKNHVNSFYGKLIDEYPDIVKYWDFDKNANIDISNITSKSGQRVWWVCSKCGASYQTKVCAVVNGSKRCVCSTCYRKSLPQVKVDSYLKNDGSFMEHYANLLDEWCYELNVDISPNQLTDKSNKKVWWKCVECGHKWKTSVAKRTEGRGCPYCAKHTKSTLQIKIENYINDKNKYLLLNEHSCTLKCYNPMTGYRLLYDNEVVFCDDIHLIIECHGQQHYEICGWTYTQAKAEKCSPKEILDYQQWKDSYKKQFAIDNGYFYLEIPYTYEENDQYKQLIDDKIHEILQLTNATK